jgi:tetratricopeptide (TPR) repeat protein
VADKPRLWFVGAMLALGIAAVYGPALGVPFIFDDVTSIVENKSIKTLWPPIGTKIQPGPLNPPVDTPGSGRPAVNLSFAVNYALSGLSVHSFHAGNLLIHFLTAMVLWAITRRALRLPYFRDRFRAASGWLALAAASVWSLHPLQTEAVIYATQRTELMLALFYLLALYCSMRYWASMEIAAANLRRRARGIWLLLAVVSCACGMASKEVMVSAPVVVLLFERTFVAGSLANALRRSWPLYVGLASTWGLLLALNISAPRAASAGFGLEVSAGTWWLTQCQVLLMYLKLVVWPSPLLIHYELPYLTKFSEAWMYVVPVAILVAGTLAMLWRNTAVGFLGAAFFAILAPTSIVPIVTEVAAERRMYLPIAVPVVLFVVSSCVLWLWAGRQWSGGGHARPGWTLPFATAMTLGLLLAITLGLRSADRLAYYADEEDLWRQVLAYQPKNTLARTGLGTKLLNAGQFDEAVEMLRPAVATRPNCMVAVLNLVEALVKSDRKSEATAVLRDAEVHCVGSPVALNNLGVAFVKWGKFDEGIRLYREVIRLRPEYTSARVNLGTALVDSGHVEEGLDQLRVAIRLAPESIEAHTKLGEALMFAGKFSDATAEFQATLALVPDDLESLNNLAYAQMQLKRDSEALAILRDAMKLDPNFAKTYTNLGLWLTYDGQAIAAIEKLREAVRLDPNEVNAHYYLGDFCADAAERDEAIEHYRTVIRLKPMWLDARKKLGSVLLQAGRLQEAIEHLESTLQLEPKLVPCYADLASALALTDRAKEAISTAEMGVAVARETGHKEAAAQLEQWLHHYRIEVQRGRNSDSIPAASPTQP